ncbi:MAG: DMT family transporter [Anaerolineae bacterium]|nr:MAG: DMT family transporter [Anaerolineae bacterium]
MQNQASRPPVGAVLALAVLAASFSSIFIRLAQSEASSLVISAYRLAIATLLLSPILLFRYRGEVRSLARSDTRLSLVAGIFLALHLGTWIASLEYTSVASSVVLVQTAPLMVAALSPLLLREQISRRLVVGLLIATVGSVIVGISDACGLEGCLQLDELFRGTAILGDLLALAGAAAAAGYVIAGRRVRRSVSLVPYIGIAYGAAAVMLIVAALFEGAPLFGFEPTTYLWLVLLAVFPQLIAHTSYNWALGYVAAAVVSLVLLSEPVAAGVLALLILNETPTTMRLVGGVLILIGIGLGTVQAKSAASES